MVPVVNYLTKSDIDARRAELLARVALPIDELRKRGAAYTLAPEEQAILRELDELDYLETGD